MISKKYCNIEFTKTGLSVGSGNFYDYVCRKTSEQVFEKEYIEELKEE